MGDSLISFRPFWSEPFVHPVRCNCWGRISQSEPSKLLFLFPKNNKLFWIRENQSLGPKKWAPGAQNAEPETWPGLGPELLGLLPRLLHDWQVLWPQDPVDTRLLHPVPQDRTGRRLPQIEAPPSSGTQLVASILCLSVPINPLISLCSILSSPSKWAYETSWLPWEKLKAGFEVWTHNLSVKKTATLSSIQPPWPRFMKFCLRQLLEVQES